MLRMSLTAGALALCLALPALAQESMSGSPTGPTRSMPLDTSTATCDQIMTRVQARSTYSTAVRMARKQNEMVAARAAQRQNDEAGCKMHAMKALQLMM